MANPRRLLGAVLGVIGVLARPAIAADQNYNLSDQAIFGYQLSAMVLVANRPALLCVITPPADTTASVTVTAFLFDDPNSSTPYAYVIGTMDIGRNERALCNVDNGIQPFAQKSPKRVEIRVAVANEKKVQSVSIPVQGLDQVTPHKGR